MADCHHDYYFYPSTNEDGWKCANCGDRPGEPAGFSPALDRLLIDIKVGGLLNDLCDHDFIHVSNGTGGDILTDIITKRCVAENLFDQYSILMFILESETPSHAKYWADVSESILAGRDKRDRCACGKLVAIIGTGKWCSFECQEIQDKQQSLF